MISRFLTPPPKVIALREITQGCDEFSKPGYRSRIFSCDREHNLATFREIASVKLRYNSDGKNKLCFMIEGLGSRFCTDLSDRPSNKNHENRDRNEAAIAKYCTFLDRSIDYRKHATTQDDGLLERYDRVTAMLHPYRRNRHDDYHAPHDPGRISGL